MFYLVCAIYAEAKPLIQHYHLKKEDQISKFQVFKNNKISLVISGTGEMSAAIATTYLLSRHQREQTDIIINIGICGALQETQEIGRPILCHKIIQHHTQKTFYPDILITHPFQEGVIETFSHPVEKEHQDEIEADYVDMESFGFFQAASTFVPVHNIYILKVISDFLSIDLLTQKKVSAYIQANLPLIDQLLKSSQALQGKQSEILTDIDKQLLQQVSENLHLSATMNHELYRLAQQYKIVQQGSLSFLLDIARSDIPSKQEGKRYFEQIKQQLIHP